MAIKKFLIPSELDAFSEKVSRFAVGLAEQMHVSEIVLLNLIMPAPNASVSSFTKSIGDDMHKRFNLLLMKKHQKLAEEEAKKYTNDKVSIKSYVRFDDSKTNLNKHAESFGADLIVCGSDDEHSFLQFFFESETGKIVRKVDYPLIVMPNEAVAGIIQNVLVPIDIGEEDQNGLREIAAFAETLNAKMQLLHVLTDEAYSSDQAIRKLRELAIQNSLDNYDINVVNDDSLEDGIRSFSRKNNSDMIAILSKGRGKIHKLIFGSSTEDIIKETNKPVYVSKNN